MELRTYIGKKPKKLKFRKTESGDVELDTKLAPNLKLDTPIMIGHMSFGAISLNSQLSMAKAVNCLEVDPISNTVRGEIATPCSRFASP